jgi:hypothetical protein
MPHPRGVRRERSRCGICRARGVNARTCPGARVRDDLALNIEEYGEQYREWIAEAHAEMMQPRKFADMMRERVRSFKFDAQSTLDVGLPKPDPTPDPAEDEDEDGVGSSQNKSGRAELPSTTERLIRAIMAGVEAFIEDLQT